MYVTKPFRALADSELKAEGITREQATRSQTDAAARDRRLIAGAGPSYRATLTQATHEAFSDELLLLNPGDGKPLELMRVVRLVTVEFFNASLKDPRSQLRHGAILISSSKCSRHCGLNDDRRTMFAPTAVGANMSPPRG